jgi:hypothetical protein
MTATMPAAVPSPMPMKNCVRPGFTRVPGLGGVGREGRGGRLIQRWPGGRLGSVAMAPV